MKTILYMACSIDGKTTKGTDDTSWVSPEDVERMDALMLSCKVMLMGRKTFESFGNDLPNEKAHLVVITNDSDLLKKKLKNVLFTDSKLQNVLDTLSFEGYETVLLAGGADLNTSMINENLIDEIRLIMKPIIIGEGKPLFNQVNEMKSFHFVSSESLKNGAVELCFTKILQ